MTTQASDMIGNMDHDIVSGMWISRTRNTEDTMELEFHEESTTRDVSYEEVIRDLVGFTERRRDSATNGPAPIDIGSQGEEGFVRRTESPSLRRVDGQGDRTRRRGHPESMCWEGTCYPEVAQVRTPWGKSPHLGGKGKQGSQCGYSKSS